MKPVSIFLLLVIYMYGRHTKNQRLISFVCLLITLIVVSSAYSIIPVQCMQILVFRIFEAVIKRAKYTFILRLDKSTNFLNMAIEKSWIVRVDFWNVGKTCVHHSCNMMSSQIMSNSILIS